MDKQEVWEIEMTVLVKALIDIWATWSLLQNFFLGFTMCLSVLSGCMCTTCMPDIRGGQKKPWIQFQRIPSYGWLCATTWVLGNLGHRFFNIGLLCLFETKFCCADQVDLELRTFLSQPPSWL